MNKQLLLTLLTIMPIAAQAMLVPTARQLARIATPLTIANTLRQNLCPVTHDTDLFAHKRWYAAVQEETQHIKAREDRAVLETLLRDCRDQANDWRKCKDNSLDFGMQMLLGYGVIAGGVFGLTGCPALVEALVYGSDHPGFFAFLFEAAPLVAIGGSPAVVLGVAAGAVAKIASVQERHYTEKTVELSRSLQLLSALAAAEKKASATDETQKTDA